mmetsp:Transcript_21877/g.59013  ORF Transcript_21877/g.59013 Transcript_21877/m.59013 type:complete len:474 (+) Transcript_21877:147-1568(+)
MAPARTATRVAASAAIFVSATLSACLLLYLRTRAGLAAEAHAQLTDEASGEALFAGASRKHVASIPLRVDFLWVKNEEFMDGELLMSGYAFLLGVEALPKGSGVYLPPRWMLLDSGSSSLAFCDETLAPTLSRNRAHAYPNTTREEDLIACNAYGSASAFWGYYYIGAVRSSEVVMPRSWYVVMEQSKMMTCTQDGFHAQSGVELQGIFGFAGPAENVVNLVPPAHPPLSLETCRGYPAAAYEPSPLREMMGGAPETPLTQIGIRWAGGFGEGQGELFLDAAATANEHFRSADAIGPFQITTSSWYQPNVTGMAVSCAGRVDSHTLPFTTMNSGASYNTLIDTGTPYLSFPPQVCQLLEAAGVATAGCRQATRPECDLLVQVAGPQNVGSLSLPFNVGKLLQLKAAVPPGLKGNPFVLFRDQQFVLGAVGFLFFDLVVLNIAHGTGTVVPRKGGATIPADLLPKPPAGLAASR